MTNKTIELLFLIIATLTIFNSCTEADLFKEYPKAKSCPGIPQIDYGGELYPTALIGNQCWMAKNLNVGKMLNLNDTFKNNDTIEKYCLYNLKDYCDFYGGLYQWDELMKYTEETDGQSICPVGWRLPTTNDFAELFIYTAGDANVLTKPYSCWNGNPQLPQNDSCWWSGQSLGFDILPSGSINLKFFEPFDYVGSKGIFWITNYNYIEFDKTNFSFNPLDFGEKPTTLYSVRCIKDNYLIEDY